MIRGDLDKDARLRKRLFGLRMVMVLAVAIPGTALVLAFILALGLPYSRWESWKVRRELLSRSGRLPEYDKLVPPEIPDDENFAMIPELESARQYLKREVSRSTDFEVAPTLFPEATAMARSAIQSAILGDVGLQKIGDIESSRAALANDGCVSPDGEAAIAILAALDEHRNDFAAIEAGVRRKSSRLPIRYDQGFQMAPIPWSSMRQIAFLFALRSTALRGAGHYVEAADDVVTILRLARAVQNDSVLLGTMIGVAIERTALGQIWDGMASHRWTLECLEKFKAELASFDELASWRRSMVLTGAATIRTLESLINNEHPTWGIADDWENAGNSTGRWLRDWRRKCAMEPFADWVAAIPESIKISNGAFSRREYEAWKARAESFAVWKDTIFDELMNATGRQTTIQRVLSVAMYRRLAVTACELEREFLSTGLYPRSISDRGENGQDICTGQPIVYQSSADQRDYRMYSLGWNELDDGGLPSENEHLDVGDWVWGIPDFRSSK